MKVKSSLILFVTALLICTLVLPAAAQAPAPEADAPGHNPPRGVSASTMRQDENGLWFKTARTGPDDAAAAALGPEGSGGPDDFGYRWTDTALNWIDAGGGTDAGIPANYSGAGPIDIGFPFKFYENTRNQLWLSRYGYLAFSSDSWSSQSRIPGPETPNEVIAPHWVPSSGFNYVRYLRGGAAPNRWFIAEWNDLRSESNHYTFEAVLRENGDIVFQYRTMTQVPGYCQSSGIEDSTGLDGLSITPFCEDIAPEHAVLISRPGPSARVRLLPQAQGQFGAPGATVAFNQAVRNTGELGSDTFDLWVDTVWPVNLYQADGTTPLVDTDGDGQLDTGVVDQGASANIVVKIALPADASIGANSAANITAISSRNPTKMKTARYQTSVPSAFAASYARSGAPTLGYYRPGQVAVSQTNIGNSYAYDPVAATLPDGRMVQVWAQGRSLANNRYVEELYYALSDNRGNVLRAAVRATDLSSAAGNTYDESPSVAVSPDGHIGIAWYRSVYRNGYDEQNYNIYFLVLDANGSVTVPLTNLTNNDVWFSWSGNTRLELYSPTIAATADNRFGIAWTRYTYDGSKYAESTWYALRGTNGGEVRAPSSVSSSTSSWSPNLASLADGTLFLTQSTDSVLAYARIDSSGNLASPLTKANTGWINAPSARQLANGNIVIAWTNGNVGYTVLNPALQQIQPATALPKMSPTNDYVVSITRSGNRAIVVWGDECCNYMPNLYYTLLDGTGNVITPPMIFVSDYDHPYLRLPYAGQGATPLIGDKPPQSRAIAPAYTVGAIPVTWYQTGGNLPIVQYDIWVRHGEGGAWTKWLAGATGTSASYTAANPGETVYFRSVATDINLSVETDVPADGDSSTTVAVKEITGRITNVRGQPVFAASVSAAPVAGLNSAKSDTHGQYHLYFGLPGSGITSLTASRAGFGQLEMRNVDLGAATESIDFVLPPEPDAIRNGGFETGDLTGWTQVQWSLPAKVEAAAAHAGGYGLRMQAPADEWGEAYVEISQSVAMPANSAAPTLSLLVNTLAAGENDSIVVRVEEASGAMHDSYFRLAPGAGWQHIFVDLGALRALPTATVRILLGGRGVRDVYLDEVSVGDAQSGSAATYLPLLVR